MTESATSTAPEAAAAQPRSTRTRLAVSLRRSEEALSPRALRKLLADLHGIAEARSDVEAAKQAEHLAHWYAQACPAERQDFWLLLAEQFAPDAELIECARLQLDGAWGTQEQGAAEVRLRRALASPRGRLLQRFAAFEQGMRFLVDLRGELLQALPGDRRLLPLDAELEALFTSWFELGSLRLDRISWDSPASLVEQLIQYEAVHDITSWADVKNRLDADRRCYGFFHPRLPGVPLIFVEVAFGERMADHMAPLLDEHAEPADLARATHAVFYSISNTQPGLKGVSFGDSLIKRVVEALQQDLPNVKHFATLSPLPGFARWLRAQAPERVAALPTKARQALADALGLEAEPPTGEAVLQALDQADLASWHEKSAARAWLLQMAAHYLVREFSRGKPLDPVARFHLGNGACVERLNWAADLSVKGRRQSWGLMVNYLYDLKRLDKHRQALAQEQVPASKAVLARLD
ncbi:malonyl-CoA decarboxylase [Comamonas serinivorans]|uniref:malonyl-CoA decarboxylase n=1 Tax=Comamonas serinivorans TaxID=1082851 RepID=UPI001F468DDC|nr:malonyl-CoA decarboxylase [Comamonas serinivorans]